jgi:hypothetical protein
MTSSRHALLRAALEGAALGAAWGVLARVWMRLLATDPGFSWAGSLFIVGLATVFGLCVGLAAESRRQGRSRWWLLTGVPALLLFAGQGMAFLPGVLVTGLLLGRRSRVARVGAVAAQLVVPVLLWWDLRLDEDTMLGAPLRAQVATLVGMPLLGWWLAWHARDVFRGARDRAPRDGGPQGQSASPERARSSLRSDSRREVPAGPA